MNKWIDLSINKSFERRNEVNKENELVDIDVFSYGLYEDLYKCNTLSVEQVYTEIWD